MDGDCGRTVMEFGECFPCVGRMEKPYIWRPANLGNDYREKEDAIRILLTLGNGPSLLPVSLAMGRIPFRGYEQEIV